MVCGGIRFPLFETVHSRSRYDTRRNTDQATNLKIHSDKVSQHSLHVCTNFDDVIIMLYAVSLGMFVFPTNAASDADVG